ncbi:putative translation elongation factor Tu [Trichuris suis]|nr:putative translation elongation factor Tu [Trichuris suis]
MSEGFQFNPNAAVFVPLSSSSGPSTRNVNTDVAESCEPPCNGSNDNIAERAHDEDVPEEWENDVISEETGDIDVAEKKSARKGRAQAAPKIRKEYVNVIFIGHVDAGKSTIGGHLMYLTGQVSKRVLEKYEKEAKEINRESWYIILSSRCESPLRNISSEFLQDLPNRFLVLNAWQAQYYVLSRTTNPIRVYLSWALDTNVEEREKGKTVQVGRANFETEHKHITILDAPGHKSFVPNMIGGASQADLAVLVISARKGEFEAGLERGGQTREHAVLVKTAGVKHMIVLINKMDDPTVNWSEERYNECRDKIIPVLKKVGFVPGKDLYFMPCSGITGAFLKEVPSKEDCSWFGGPCFLDYLDQLPPISRAREGPVRIVLFDKYNDMGTVVMGKVESGTVTKGQSLVVMPNRTPVQTLQLWCDEDEADEITTGENVKLKLKGIEEDSISSGFVLCSPEDLCVVGHVFDAQVIIMEHKSIICPGYSAVLHIHAAVEEVSVKALICLVDRKTGEKSLTRPKYVKQDQICIMRLESSDVFCLEPFKKFPQMGRFVLRDEGRTIAIGKVLKIVE